VEKQTVLLLVQIVDTNGTLEPTLDSRKSDRADGAIVVAASRLLVFLIVVVLLLGRLLPHERDTRFQLFSPRF
jgi:hypothetical protein